ncbi:MAG: SDR family oxidoreductase [Acidiferrobacterales bacterium]|nr:SDR family oxidoreductase [Acidiferrobacterales bacterium]
MRFKNKVALVTGAAGGIGRSVVEHFAREGATIAAADQSREQLLSLRKIADEYQTEVVPFDGNLGDTAYCDSLPTQVFEKTGQLDIVVNNAGIITRGNVLEATDEDWSRSMTINVEAVFRICRNAIGLMIQNNGGTIVNVASCWGLYPGPDHAIYCTSKAAVAALSKCMGRDHAHQGVRVNAVCPNEVNTPMLHTGFSRRGFDPDSAITELGKTVPVGRIAEPDDIAEVIVFLASNASKYITGATLEVNGGKPVY